MLSRFSPACRRRGNFTCEVDANMSMPNLPDVQIDREGGINAILAAIGMEELSLAHLLNAEGEKIQMALGTLREGDEPFAAEEIYRVNESARRMVRDCKFRGHSPEKTLSMWKNVCIGEDRFIKVFKPEADLLLDTSFSYEICCLAPSVIELARKLPETSQVDFFSMMG